MAFCFQILFLWTYSIQNWKSISKPILSLDLHCQTKFPISNISITKYLPKYYLPMYQYVFYLQYHFILSTCAWQYTGCPKKNYLSAHFWVLSSGGVFLGVKNNSKNFGNRKNIRLLSKILSKWTLFYSKYSNFLAFLWLWQFQNVKNNLKSQNI